MATAVRLSHVVRERQGTNDLAYAAEVTRASSPRRAALATLEYCFATLDRPVGAWARHPDSGDLHHVGVMGLGSPRGDLAESDIGPIPPWNLLSTSGRVEILRRFGELVGHQPVEDVFATDVLILVGGVDLEVSGHLAAVRSLLRAARARRSTPDDHMPDPVELALASAAHEIRGPILAARSAVERVLQHPGSPSSQGLLERSVAELGQLAETLVRLLRWSSGTGDLVLEATPVGEVIRDASRVGSTEAIRERVMIVHDDSVALVDPQHLMLALANLIRNALAYSADHTPVIVTARGDGHSLRITVSDSGPGLPASERDRVFAPFVRGRSSESIPGSGLGLFIARKIVEAHGGRLDVQSRPDGTDMTLDLPQGRTLR